MPIDAAIASQLLLGRYRVLEERGKGGFGTVSVCWDPRLMRRVAIKSIPLRTAAPVATAANRTPTRREEAVLADLRRHDMLLQAALAETRTASMLAHPSIVAMLDFEDDDQNAYIIMEYVEGASLAELLDATEDGLLTADEAAAVVEGVCDALQFAHDNGVLHLDIKPDNILVDMTGRVRLADFGMAALSSATGYAGARGGTVGYMPPEQIEGEHVDVRTDVFAFACVMYEALTGTRPFCAPTVQESLELVETGVPDPCALNEGVSPQAADTLLVALDPDPAMRPVSAEAFGDQMLMGLGRPKAGRKSLAAFVADVLDDSEPSDAVEEALDGESAYLPYAEDPDAGVLARSYPRLGPREARGLGAVVAGVTAAAAVSALVPGNQTAVSPAALVALVAVAALGCAAPQLGYAVALAALAAAALAAGHWVTGALVVAAGATWWVLVARRRPCGAAPSLLAGAWASPIGAMLCGYLLPPGCAALSALVGAVASAAWTQLHATPVSAAAVMGWAGCVAAAAATGALCHNGGKARCYLGCVTGGIVLGAFLLVAGRMENGGSWTGLSPEVLAAVVGSTILAAIVVFLFGTPSALDVDGVHAEAYIEEDQERGVV